jgi:transposase InsO family protein
MDTAMARRCKLEPVPSARTVKLADGSIKTATGTVTAVCSLQQADGRSSPLEFEGEFCVTELQGYDVILGMPWLSHFNPAIDWSSGRLVVQRQGLSPAVLERCASAKSEDERIEPEVASLRQLDCGSISYARMARAIRKGNIDLNSLEIMKVTRLSPEELAQPGKSHLLPHRLAGADADQPQDPQLATLLKKYAHLLPAELPPGLPPDRPIEHKIELTGDAKPHAAPLRRYSPLEDEEIRKQVMKLVERGHARESTSPWGAMVLLAKKKDGSLRFCVDYRVLNNQTLKNRYALPLADDCFDRAQGARFFSKLDLHSGFWQIRLAEGSAPLTAFRTRFGHYEFTVLPMGLCNAPATFMHLMNSVLRKQLDKFVLAFLDDIFIYSKTRDEHLLHIEEVLKELDAQKLYLKPSKCEWMKPEVEFLGHRIGREGLSVDPQKIDAVRQWPTPTNVSEIRSFLGLAGYYRRFISNYSSTALPLTELTKDEVEWKWQDEQRSAFESLKQQLSAAPVLLLANPDLPYVIHCDASGFAVGACLMQDQGSGLQPVSYISSKMKPAETRYAPHEQELLALVYACNKWRHYLHNGRPFTVLSDHQSLRYFTTQPDLSARQARWKDKLAEFDFTIRYIEGPKNVVADALSRRADHQLKEDDASLQGTTRTREEFLASARAIGPEPDPAAEEAQRRMNIEAATKVVPPAPDLPEPNRRGAIAMPTQRCTAEGKNGKQCRARTKRGQYCFAHRRLLCGTRITRSKVSGAGMGLMATKDFAPDETIGLYTGELRHGGGGAYYLALRMAGGDANIDAARTNTGDGRWVNDPRGMVPRVRPNCELAGAAGSTSARVRATRRIKAGEEFFLAYGPAYWRAMGHRLPRKAAARPAPGMGRKRPPQRQALVAAMSSANAGTRLSAVAELSAATLARGDFELVAEAREAAQKDSKYAEQLSSPPEGWTERDGLLWLGPRLCVPNDKALQTKLIAELHDTPTGGHFGRDKTLAALQKRFHWAGMSATVASYVASCDMCLRVKHGQRATPGLLMPLPVPEEIDSHWTMDFVTGLPKTARGHDAIQGHFSRGGALKRLAATDTTVDAARAADTFVDSVVRHHGVPASIVSDRGPQFVSALWESLWARLGTKLERSTAHHAQTDGKSEREQKTLETWLRAFCTEFPLDWDRLLPLAELALNSMPQAASGVSPYQLLYGREPALSVDRALDPLAPVAVSEEPSAAARAAKARWAQMTRAWERVRGKLLIAQERMKRNADKHRRPAQFEAGDAVLLSTEHLKVMDPQFNRKLAHLYCGPFPVKRVVNDNAYELELPAHMHIHATVNISHLRPYVDGRAAFPDRPAAPGLTRPPPAAADPADPQSAVVEYEVERVLAQRGAGANAKYLVLWKGYPYTEATWEPRASLTGNATAALSDFAEMQKAMRRPSRTSDRR